MIFDNMDYGSDPNRNPKMQLRGTSSLIWVVARPIWKEHMGQTLMPRYYSGWFRATVQKSWTWIWTGGESDDLERRVCKGYLRFKSGKRGCCWNRKTTDGSYGYHIPGVSIFLSRIYLPITWRMPLKSQRRKMLVYMMVISMIHGIA